MALGEWKPPKEAQIRTQAQAWGEALDRQRAEGQAALRACKRQAEALRDEEERSKGLHEATGSPTKRPPRGRSSSGGGSVRPCRRCGAGTGSGLSANET